MTTGMQLQQFTEQVEIFKGIIEERMRQDEQWGGPDHDDNHSSFDWLDFIDHQMNRARYGASYDSSLTSFRERMIRIAALAFAAVESTNRKIGA